MTDPKYSIFHKIYDFDVWIYSDWMENWLRLATRLEPISEINSTIINFSGSFGSSKIINCLQGS